MESAGLTATEAECAKGRTAPRVSLDDIKANIDHVYFATGDTAVQSLDPGRQVPIVPSLCVLTLCIAVLQNGFTIIGKSAPASADNFDPELGQKLAYEDAVRQIWPLMGYELRQRVFTQGTDEEPAPPQEPAELAATDGA